eukprot:762559-Hanusia_phi.AAC.12
MDWLYTLFTSFVLLAHPISDMLSQCIAGDGQRQLAVFEMSQLVLVATFMFVTFRTLVFLIRCVWIAVFIEHRIMRYVEEEMQAMQRFNSDRMQHVDRDMSLLMRANIRGVQEQHDFGLRITALEQRVQQLQERIDTLIVV